MERMLRTALVGAAAAWLLASPVPAGAQKVTSANQAAEPLVVRDVGLKDGEVAGAVVNTGSSLVKDVKLLIRFVWHWKTEMTPGEDNPGRAVFHSLADEIPPGGQARFAYRVNPPLPLRSDGWFAAAVEVVGFSEVGE